ncbi:MAG: aldehyde dehydrogenase family protein [Rhodoferax sp.]|nr:aldehyde dehydrogenase family protein [Rhodoferax sp.]
MTANYTLTINGQAVPGDAESFPIFNPATGALLGHAPASTRAQVDVAVTAARAAQPAWAALPDDERRALVVRVAEILATNSQYLAEWITREQGKPLTGPGALFEMQACVGWTQVAASLELPMEVAFEDDTRRDEIHRKPIGVVAAIAPWNWPLMIAIWQIIPALRAGNTVVLKPSEYTPLGTLEMVRLINAVLPPGVLNTVSGNGRTGDVLVRHPDVKKIMFTGSAATGRKIIEASAGNMARLTLELGGNDAAIVLPSADVQAMAQGLFWGAFLNMGQTCACIKRLYVHESHYENVISALKALAESIPMGDGMQEGILLGPVQNRMQFEKVVALVDAARNAGARIVTGGKPKADSLFYPVTLVADVKDGNPLVDEEQFGPALPIIVYSDVNEAVRLANRLDVALGASVWGNDIEELKRVATKLEAGTVWINQHGAIHPMVPFGGIKASGYGVEFGIEGLKAVTVPQVISIKK